MTEPDPLPASTDLDGSAPPEDRCPQCQHEVGGAWLVCAFCGRALAAPAELAAGTRLADGRYQVLDVLGRGGFGITYDMGDRRLHRRVAVKELFPESAVRHGSLVLTPPERREAFRTARDRFMREARVLARFTHPGIVRVYEVFEEHGTAYLVMELLEGRTLIDLLKQHGRPFDEAAVLDVTGRVAAALRPVHAAGVLHRDVNPSNVMMTDHGRIVVIDFGLARDYDQDRTVGMTRVVTPGYAPLEQYRGEGRFGPSTDVYGLAATCYRVATGKVPTSAVERDGGAPLAPPRAVNGAISKSVSDAILDGLELEPTHRPQDLDTFLARLGVARLPDGPRSMLIDLVPRPSPGTRVSDVERAGDADRPDPDLGGGPDATGAQPWRPGGGAGGDPTRGADSTGSPDRTRVGPPGVEPATALGGADPDAPATATQRRSPAEDRQDRRVVPAPPPAAGWDRGARDRQVGPGDGPARIFGDPIPPRMPGVIGPHRRGRRKLLVPLWAVAMASASAAPVLVSAVVVWLVLPCLATLGDSVAHRLRIEHGVAMGWAERRMAPGSLAPARFLRNVLFSTVRALPMVVVGAVLLVGWYGLDGLVDAQPILDAGLRAIGLLMVGVILATTRHGSARFRTHLGLDDLVRRWVPDGRTSERLVVLWIISLFVVAAAIWLTPSPFPLP